MSVKEEALKLQKSVSALYESGKKAEHDKMWDRIQMNGTLTNYNAVTGYFNGKTFGFNNFYPKYDIKPVGNANVLFYAWENDASIGITDNDGSLKQRLNECGVVLDTSGATSLHKAFAYTYITELPVIDVTGIESPNNTAQVFAYGYSRLKTIEKIITKEEVTYTKWFLQTDLTNITFEGVIGKDIDFSYSTNITVESMKSAILHLKNYTGTDSEFTYTISFSENRWTALEADSTAPDGNTWRNYVGTLGWNT